MLDQITAESTYFSRVLSFTFSNLKIRHRPDLVIASDVTAALPAIAAARGDMSRIILDVCETPVFKNRTSEWFRKSRYGVEYLLQRTADHLGRRALGVMASSTGFAEAATVRYQRPVGAAIAFDAVRTARAPVPEPRNRNLVQDATDTRNIAIAWPSLMNEPCGADLFRQMAPYWDPSWELRVIAEAPEEGIAQLLTNAGIRFRVTGYLSRRHYLKAISECDIALMALNTNWPNIRLCLPNRLLDCLSVGIPFVSTPQENVSRLLAVYPNAGRMSDDREPQSIVTSIRAELKRSGSANRFAEADVASAFGGKPLPAVLRELINKSPHDFSRALIVVNRPLRGTTRIGRTLEMLAELGIRATCKSRFATDFHADEI